MANSLDGDEVSPPADLKQIMDTWNKPLTQTAQSIITIIFTDMVGSTDMTQAQGDIVAQGVVRRHNSIVRNALRDYQGKEIKHTGDGIMASFASAANAVEATISIQRQVKASNARSDLPLHLRIGINSGEPIQEENDLFGGTVQLAARVCAKAGTDQILCTNVVKELSSGKGLGFINRGEHALKGFKEEMLLWEVPWDEQSPAVQAASGSPTPTPTPAPNPAPAVSSGD
jgi:class 3 adenylate cyclase